MEVIKYPFGRMCRACMCKEQNFHSMLEFTEQPSLKICEMLATAVPQLFIQTGDQLPEFLCTVCLNKLNIAYNFQQMCVSTDKRLRSIVLNQALEHKYNPALVASPFSSKEDDPLLESNVQNTSKYKSHSNQITQLELMNFLETTLEEKPNGIKENQQNLSTFKPENDGRVCSDDETLAKIKEKSRSSSQKRNLKNASHFSNMHNETGTGEIEKPDSRNTRRGQYPCADCGKIFDRPYRLRRHISVHSHDRPYECDVCRYRFQTKNHMVCHRLRHFDDLEKDSSKLPAEGYKCSECPRRFEKSQSLAAHSQAHRRAGNSDDGQQLTCEFCASVFKSLKLLSNHMKTHPESERYKCHLCDKSYALEAHLIEHIARHNGIKQYVCIYCDKAFQQNSTLKDHIRTHTGEKPFLCPKCGKSFQSGSNLRQHLLRHSSEKRYQCPECPSKFACQSDQTKHMSVHRKTKPHVCDTCGASFSRSYTLSKHKLIHSGKRPYKCEECDMTFVFVDHMRRHKRTHTGEKPYKCQYCERAYGDSGDLIRHLRSHMGEKTYKCNDCSEAFKYHTELRDHLIVHFKQQKASAEDMKSGTSIPIVEEPKKPEETPPVINVEKVDVGKTEPEKTEEVLHNENSVDTNNMI